MSDLPYNNNPKEECFYCSHTYTFHFSSSSSDDDNNQEKGIESKKKDSHHANPKGCSFVNKFDKRSCNCPGFRSSLSITTNEQLNNNIRKV